MIHIKNKSAINKMEMAGKLLAEICEQLPEIIQPGITTLAIDTWVAKKIHEKGLVSRMHGYHGYRHVTCVSVNEQVVHGVPSEKRVLRSGDLVKVDVCASWNGYCADMARCFFVDKGDQKVQDLVRVAYDSLNKGIEQVQVRNRIGDISAAVQREVEANGFGVVQDFAGHGIGKSMHEDPEILNYGKPGTGPEMRAGMAFAIEPMITLGHYDVIVLSDGWTVETVDKSFAAHVEDTVVVTEHGPMVLTRL